VFPLIVDKHEVGRVFNRPTNSERRWERKIRRLEYIYRFFSGLNYTAEVTVMAKLPATYCCRGSDRGLNSSPQTLASKCRWRCNYGPCSRDTGDLLES